MLDFLFGLGQALALLALASGFIITICCGKRAEEARNTQRQIADPHPFGLRSENEAVIASLTTFKTKPEHVPARTADWS